MRDNDLVGMGFVRGAFGVRGWVKIQANTEYADSLFEYSTWWLGKGDQWTPYRLLDGEVHTDHLVVRLEGIAQREDAAALKGLTVAVPRSEFPEPDDDEYYWTDLIGLTVFDTQGVELGKVVELMETGGANDVLVVQTSAGKCLIPFVERHVPEVDIAAGKIIADWALDY